MMIFLLLLLSWGAYAEGSPGVHTMIAIQETLLAEEGGAEDIMEREADWLVSTSGQERVRRGRFWGR